MTSRSPVPQHVADEVLAANRHTCCTCRTPRKHVQLHHIDGDRNNHDPANLAVLCLDCHSRIEGDEGLGRRFSQREVRRYKESWENECAGVIFSDDENSDDDEDDDDEEPSDTFYETALLHAGEHRTHNFDLQTDDRLLATIEADDYIDAFLCSKADYDRWVRRDREDELPAHFDGAEEVRRRDLTLIAPRRGTYTVLVTNWDEEDTEVTVDVSVWNAER